MYRLTATIPNHGVETLTPELCFNPAGTMFAVVYSMYNEIRIFDARTRAVLRTYKGATAGLDQPHGIDMTDRHIVVGNIHKLTRPSTLNVYRIDDTSDEPVSSYTTPYAQLREVHSLAIHKDVLLATYCEGGEGGNALVSYRFDDETGEISDAVDIRDWCYEDTGQPKGVSFNSDASQVYVTFNTPKLMMGMNRVAHRLRLARQALKERGLMACISESLPKISRLRARPQRTASTLKNGIAVFEIDDQGIFSREAINTLFRDEFCCLENIQIVGDTVAISDTINNRVLIYGLAKDPLLENPRETITDEMALPHGVKLSPDQKTLLVTNFGMNVKDQVILWGSWTSPRSDRIQVYEFVHD